MFRIHALTIAALGVLAISGSVLRAAVTFNSIVDTTMTAPGHGAFNSFDLFPSISGSNVTFLGNYSGGQGIYTGLVGAPGAAKIVDTGDTAPGHGNCTAFSSAPTTSGGNN